MKGRLEIFFDNIPAGIFTQQDVGKYHFEYYADYVGQPISLRIPISQTHYEFLEFPAVFEGLLPEGTQLETLLKETSLDANDYFGQLLIVGADLAGAITARLM